jgi:hypothetical protein
MDCACDHAAFGDASPPRFPTVEKVLARYIRDCLNADRPFYISPELNSDALADMKPHADQIYQMVGKVPANIEELSPNPNWAFDEPGFGQFEFIPAILSAIGSVAATVGSTVAAVAPTIATVAGTVASVKTIQAANNSSSLQNQGIAIPTTLAPQVTAATQQDLIAGIPNNALLLYGGMFLFALVLLKR